MVIRWYGKNTTVGEEESANVGELESEVEERGPASGAEGHGLDVSAQKGSCRRPRAPGRIRSYSVDPSYIGGVVCLVEESP